ncbi:MAG TPA: hypothetical protein DEB35_12220 [Desulfuromonas sp.]|nr:hypothetical protein [Desulfuromonas sp.]
MLQSRRATGCRHNSQKDESVLSLSLPSRPRVLFLISLTFFLAGCWADKPAAPRAIADPPLPSVKIENPPTLPPELPVPAAVVVPPAPTSPVAPGVGPEAAAVPSAVPAAAVKPVAAKSGRLAGEDPEFARKCGWPVACSEPLPGAILPAKRIVAYYGNPMSRRMGALGQYPKEEMLKRLKEEVNEWEKADPKLPVQPALHLVAVVAQDIPGKSGKYRKIMDDDMVNMVYAWAKEEKALLFLDIQTGHEDIRTLLPRFEWILKNPDVHLGIDPEFNLRTSLVVPGTKIGTYDAAEINFVTEFLQGLVQKYKLPPKVLTVHRFTQNGVTNARKIVLRPEVQVVMHMDGWGGSWLKRTSYRDYVVAEPVQYTGFKIFYHNDTKKGDPLMAPADLLRLNPQPLYIQYQ